nr:hypothetical protein [Tanacetum cinerariifolium]
MDVPLSPDHAFDFFAAEPVSGLAEAPNNQNRWIEWDVPLGGEMDEPMENPRFDEEEELDEFMDDDMDVLDEDEEWLMAPVTPPRATVTVLSTYDVGGPSTATMSNLEYRHREFVKKMVKVSDAEVADSITIGEIHPRVDTVEEQVQVMASQAMQVVSGLEEIENRVQQVESRVDTYPSDQMAVPRQDVVVGLSQQ